MGPNERRRTIVGGERRTPGVDDPEIDDDGLRPQNDPDDTESQDLGRPGDAKEETGGQRFGGLPEGQPTEDAR
jgi:hypothetical protein